MFNYLTLALWCYFLFVFTTNATLSNPEINAIIPLAPIEEPQPLKGYTDEVEGFSITLSFESSNDSSLELSLESTKEESSTVLPTMMKDFADHGVKQYVNTKVVSIENDGKCVKALNTAQNEELSIECDMVVMAAGSVKNVLDVEGVTTPLFYAGDCSGERTAGIAEAIRSGYKAGNEI